MRIAAIITGITLVIFLIILLYTPVPSPSGEGAVLRVDEELLIKFPPRRRSQAKDSLSKLSGPISKDEASITTQEPKKKAVAKKTFNFADIKEVDLKTEIDNHPLTKTLPNVIGEMKPLFVPVKDDYSVLANFDILSGGKFGEAGYSYTYKLGEQVLSLQIVTFSSKDGPKRQVAGDATCVSSYSGMGIRGDQNGLVVGDYNFVRNVEAADRITFVRNNVYCRLFGHGLPYGMIKDLAEEIDLKIQESRIED